MSARWEKKNVGVCVCGVGGGGEGGQQQRSPCPSTGTSGARANGARGRTERKNGARGTKGRAQHLMAISSIRCQMFKERGIIIPT